MVGQASATPQAWPLIHWVEGGLPRTARWRSESGIRPHKRVVIADEKISANTAYHLACEGTAILWRGDFQNARQILQAMARRIDAKARATRPSQRPPNPPPSPAEAFHLHRLAQSQRARTLGMLLIPLSADYSVPLQRAPDLRAACEEAYGPCPQQGEATDSLVSLRELLGLIGAHEWHKKGVEIAALNARIYPHYGVFAPIRSEYVTLIAKTPLPIVEGANTLPLAFDIGTGTGVLAAVLAQRGVARVVATDADSRALHCARDNIRRLKLTTQIEAIEADLFPPGCAPLIVCNPPWIPARPSAPIENAIYDPDSRMLRGFIAGLAAHLTPGGEGWLILSDIAEHLGLRTRATLLGYIEAAGLNIIDRIDVRPSHPRTADTQDPLHAARAAEITSLWRLGVR